MREDATRTRACHPLLSPAFYLQLTGRRQGKSKYLPRAGIYCAIGLVGGLFGGLLGIGGGSVIGPPAPVNRQTAPLPGFRHHAVDGSGDLPCGILDLCILRPSESRTGLAHRNGQRRGVHSRGAVGEASFDRPDGHDIRCHPTLFRFEGVLAFLRGPGHRD